MPEYLDDPSVLTKDKLKSELLANNVELPSGNPTKDVYVQLYLKNLTAQNKRHVAATILDAFSSDEELPPPVVSNRSRSSGRKATRKTDKVRPDELDVTVLTDEGLRDELLKYGVDVGPIVATTRKLYEKKLQKLLDDGPTQPSQPQMVVTEIQINHNGNSESDLYSDKEDEVTPEPEQEPVPEPEPEPVAEPEPVPVVERTVRSRGKTPVTGRTRSSQHHTRDLLLNGEDNDEDCVLNVKRRSRGLYHRTTVTEDLRPISTDQDQSVYNLMVYQKPGSTAQAKHSSTSSMPAQEHQPIVKRVVVQSVTPLNPLFMSKSLAEEQCSRRAAKPSSPLAGPARVDPITFSPMCNISPIKSQESHWAPSDQAAPKPNHIRAVGEECAPPDVWLHGGRQQKITSLMSKCISVKTHGYTSQLSRDMLARKVEKIVAGDQSTKVDETDVLKELFPNDLNSPTGISATCRRPIRGAAGRPVKSSDLWNNENSLFSPKTTTNSSSSSSSYAEKLSRVTSLPSSTPSTFSSSFSSSSSSRLLTAAPPAGQTKAVRRSFSFWIKLFLLAIVAAFLFLVYQAMETNTDAPFGDAKVSSNNRA